MAGSDPVANIMRPPQMWQQPFQPPAAFTPVAATNGGPRAAQAAEGHVGTPAAPSTAAAAPDSPKAAVLRRATVRASAFVLIERFLG